MAEAVKAHELGCEQNDASSCYASMCKISELALSLLGPHGRHIMAHRSGSSDALLMSSISHRVCQVLQNRSLACQLLIQSTVDSQHVSHGDGGLFALSLAASLVERVMRESGGVVMTRLMMLQGIQLALDWCMECIYGHRTLQCICPMCPREAATCPRPKPHGSSCCSIEGLCDMAGEDSAETVPCVSESTQQLARRLSMKDLPSMMALVRSVISPKKVALSEAKEVDTLCALVVGAFVASIPTSQSAMEGDRGPCVRTIEVVGLPPTSSERLQGVLLDTPTPHYAADLLPLQNTSILLFNTALDIQIPSSESLHGTGNESNLVLESLHLQSGGTGGRDKGHPIDDNELSSHGSTVQVRDGMLGGDGVNVGGNVSEVGRVPCSQLGSGGGREGMSWRAQLGLLDNIAEWAQRMRVGVVACQKVIHPYLQERLASRGIVALERLSFRHMAAVSRVSSARPISSRLPCTEWAEALGSLSCVSLRSFSSSKYVLLEGLQDRKGTGPVATLVLCGWTQSAVEELVAVTSDALRILTRALHTPHVVSGAGHFEASLACHIRECAKGAFSARCLPTMSLEDEDSPSEEFAGGQARIGSNTRACTNESCIERVHHSCCMGGGQRLWTPFISGIASWPSAHVFALQQGALAVEHSLRKIAIVVGGQSPCGCKLGSNSSGDVDVLDLLDVKVGALKRALDSACLILRSTLASA